MEEKEISKAFGRNLRAARKAIGLTQTALAQQLGYSSKAVSKWESGEAIAHSVLLPTLARHLHTDINSLMRVSETVSYYVGIDGGGTKTEFLLAQEGGEILRRLVLEGCNPNDVGLAACTELLKRGIRELCAELPRDEISLFAGIAGCMTGNNRHEILQALSTLGFHRCDCNSDAVNAVQATLGDRDGIMIIAGTGNITFVQRDGVRHRLGGFNYLFEEGGSGYMLGHDALYYALKTEEKGKTDTLLYRLVLEKCATPTVLDDLAALYKGGKQLIASFAPIVFAAAKEGDPQALQILRRNAAVLAEEIEEGAALLGQPDPQVVLIGGLCQQEELLFPLILEQLHIKCRLRSHRDSLAKGALKMAGWEEKHA